MEREHGAGPPSPPQFHDVRFVAHMQRRVGDSPGASAGSSTAWVGAADRNAHHDVRKDGSSDLSVVA